MVWRHPTYLWFEVVPILVCMAWCVAEWRRKRRMEAFGDPGVMGMTIPWLPRAAGVLFLIVGSAATTALLPLPSYEGDDRSVPPPVIRILLDVQSMDLEDDGLYRLLEDSVQGVLRQAAGLRCSIVVPGQPLETWVPATEDGTGLQILLARLRFEMRGEVRPNLAEILPAVSRSKATSSTAADLVILTALPAEEVENLFEQFAENVVDLPVVRLSKSGQPVLLGRRTLASGWTWTARSGSFPELDYSSLVRIGESRRNFGPLQQLALIAFLLLSLEFVCSLAARSTAMENRLA